MDELWRRTEIESPCIKLCVIHPETRLCTGCLRSIDEIAAWGRMSPEERHALIERLPERQAQHRKRRGGRAGRIERKGG